MDVQMMSFRRLQKKLKLIALTFSKFILLAGEKKLVLTTKIKKIHHEKPFYVPATLLFCQHEKTFASELHTFRGKLTIFFLPEWLKVLLHAHCPTVDFKNMC